MSILGISCFYHDSSASLLGISGDIICSLQEERFSRIKHDNSFPKESIKYSLSQANLLNDPIELIVFYENPLIKFDRIVESHLNLLEKAKEEFIDTMSSWLGGKLYQINDIEEELSKLGVLKNNPKISFIEHHLSHAASAFYPSNYTQAAVITLDGVGERTTTAIWDAEDKDIRVIEEMPYPNSLGLLYSAFTYFTGFKVNSGEYKMMGLAPYGDPVYVDLIKDNILNINTDGTYKINQKCFDSFTKHQIINENFTNIFGFNERHPSDPINKKYLDVSASIQLVVEEAVLNIVKRAINKTGKKKVCMAGGVALNSVANGRIKRELNLKNFWIQPAAGDAGGSLGAALYGHYKLQNYPRIINKNLDAMQGSLLGTFYSNEEIKEKLDDCGAIYTQINEDQIYSSVAKLLTEGNVIGWFQGKMEYGPRALGARSIIADPRSTEMQKKLNLKIKKRESFRPFAPAVLEEKASEWFDLEGNSPYMLLVCPVAEKKRNSTKKNVQIDSNNNLKSGCTGDSQISAVTHVDFSARVQTVNCENNEKFHRLITCFDELTGCPVIVNTSFNVRGEPIVESPEDAFKCLVNTEMDYLSIGNFLIKRKDQDPLVVLSLFQEFEDD